MPLEDLPDLAQAALLALFRRRRRLRVIGGKDRLRPIKSGEAQPGLFAMGNGQRAKGSAMESSLEGDNHTSVLGSGQAGSDQQRGFDGVLDRFGARVYHKMTWCSNRREAIKRRLEPKRYHRLVLAVGVAVGHRPG